MSKIYGIEDNGENKRYLKLFQRGQQLFPKVVNELNKYMRLSYNVKADSEPDYRTEGAWKEICVALALIDEYWRKQ